MIIEMFKTVKNSMIKMELYQKIDRESRDEVSGRLKTVEDLSKPI